MSAAETKKQIAELERRHPDHEWRPWACNDDPLALEHWRLVQELLNLKQERKKVEWTPERRAAVGRRFQQARMERLKAS